MRNSAAHNGRGLPLARIALPAIVVLALALPARAQVSGDFGGVNGGAVRVGASTSTCDATTEGAIKYVDGSNRVELCDDNTWIAVGTGSTGPLEVTGAAGSEVVRNLDSVAPYTTADFVFGSPQLDDDADVNHRHRMFFDKSKAAFRAGRIINTNWDDVNRGSNSAALGANTMASGTNSMAWGESGVASGTWNATAFGKNTQSTGSHTTAWGESTTASNIWTTAFGYQTTASGQSSTAWGYQTQASGQYSTAFGLETRATGGRSVAIGLGDSTGSGSQATDPKVSGDGSMGIFMGDQENVDVTAGSVVVLMGGKLGVGLVSPSNDIHTGNATGGNVRLSREDATTITDELLGELLFDSSDAASTTDASAAIRAYASIAHATTDKGGYLTFWTKADTANDSEAAVERMRITSAGNVGIGVTSPNEALEVHRASGSDTKLLLTDGDVSHPMTAFEPNANTFLSMKPMSSTGGGAHLAGYSDSDVTGMRISGYVGSTTPTVSPLRLIGGKWDGGGGGTSVGATEKVLTIENFGSAAVTVLGDGKTGFGQATPNQGIVEVKGGSVCVDTNSDDNASSCIANESDVRLKRNVLDLPYGLDTVMRLRPVSFDWRTDDPEVLKHYSLISRFADRPHSIGLIAQDVQTVIPEAIEAETVGDAEVQYLQLDYTKLVPVLIKGMQELKTENDALRARVDALESAAAR